MSTLHIMVDELCFSSLSYGQNFQCLAGLSKGQVVASSSSTSASVNNPIMHLKN